MKFNEILTSINMFISKSTQDSLSFYKLLKKEAFFEWSPECQHTFSSLKMTLSMKNHDFSNEATNTILVRYMSSTRSSLYFISKALTKPQTHYQKIEKVALASIITSKKLRCYLLAHAIVI